MNSLCCVTEAAITLRGRVHYTLVASGPSATYVIHMLSVAVALSAGRELLS